MPGIAPASPVFTLGSLAGRVCPGLLTGNSDIPAKNHSPNQTIEVHMPTRGLVWAGNGPVVSLDGGPILRRKHGTLPKMEQRLPLVPD